MFIKSLLTFFVVLFVMSGCTSKYSNDSDLSDWSQGATFQSASLENTIKQRDLKYKKYKELTKSKKDINTFALDDRIDLNLELFDFYSEWEGVKYKLGGDSKGGIDCSAFIKKAFEEKFYLSMPRTTTMQSEVGKQIDKNELLGGDLVFFKTGESNHVGIYLEDGKFIHASTKNGVTISDIDNSYFSQTYWKAQRVID